jgi:hypothetical protein
MQVFRRPDCRGKGEDAGGTDGTRCCGAWQRDERRRREECGRHGARTNPVRVVTTKRWIASSGRQRDGCCSEMGDLRELHCVSQAGGPRTQKAQKRRTQQSQEHPRIPRPNALDWENAELHANHTRESWILRYRVAWAIVCRGRQLLINGSSEGACEKHVVASHKVGKVGVSVDALGPRQVDETSCADAPSSFAAAICGPASAAGK